jgi:hypothetical protein
MNIVVINLLRSCDNDRITCEIGRACTSMNVLACWDDPAGHIAVPGGTVDHEKASHKVEASRPRYVRGLKPGCDRRLWQTNQSEKKLQYAEQNTIFCSSSRPRLSKRARPKRRFATFYIHKRHVIQY